MATTRQSTYFSLASAPVLHLEVHARAGLGLGLDGLLADHLAGIDTEEQGEA